MKESAKFTYSPLGKVLKKKNKKKSCCFKGFEPF